MPRNCFIRTGVALALAFVLVPPVSAQGMRSGTFKTVQGVVTVVQGETRRAALVGEGVYESERIVTGAGASAAVTLKDGTVLMVGSGSTLDLPHFRFEPATQSGSLVISLFKGSMRMVTGLLGKLHPERVLISTPTATVGVRGTDFIVEVP
jgi:hypothetical protein